MLFLRFFLSLSALAAAAGEASTGAAAESTGASSAHGTRVFTGDELSRYNGKDSSRPILLAVDGIVYDVTSKGSHLYGPGGSYAPFAGSACGRGVVLTSLAPEDVTDDFDDFDDAQKASLAGWVTFFDEKFVCRHTTSRVRASWREGRGECGWGARGACAPPACDSRTRAETIEREERAARGLASSSPVAALVSSWTCRI